MSVAVAVSKAGELVLASDSQTSFGGERIPPQNRIESKFRKVGAAYVASTGWTLYSNILEDVLARRRSVPRLDGEARIFVFFNELWKLLHDRYSFVNDQSDSDDDGPFGSLDSSFMVVSPHGIFSVATDLAVARFERYFSIGSGSHVAVGAIHALYDSDLDATGIAEAAVHAAIDHDIYCGPPVQIVKLRASRAKAGSKS